MATPHPTGVRETGWLPDLVYTGGRFEAGLAFFADPLGRITRFSREAADLAAARRLEGQAALPGLVDACAHVLARPGRGRAEGGCRPVADAASARIVARAVFVEMLLSGVTCVAAVDLNRGTATPEIHQEILRAAREIGIRVALCPLAFPGVPAAAYIQAMDALRVLLAQDHPGDEAWLAAGLEQAEAFAGEALKALGAYAHTQRLRMIVPLAAAAVEGPGAQSALQAMAEHGIVDKRLVLVARGALSPDELRRLATARAALAVCPADTQHEGGTLADLDAAADAGATVVVGSGRQRQSNFLGVARQMPERLRKPPGVARAQRLFHAMTVGGARGLGAPSGALEVGRPADFFTVNLYDPSIAGSDPEMLLESIVFSAERRAVRDVWIGGRLRLSGGRHAQQGPVIGRYVDWTRNERS